MPLGDKYIDLTRYLEHSDADEITLSFEQIANIVGGLPPVAYNRRETWSNGGYNSLSYGWLNAGFLVNVKFTEQLVTFIKGEPIKRGKGNQVRRGNTLLGINMAISSILKYHTTTTEGIHTRFRSWDHCYRAFRENRDCHDRADYLCLHLAWYLASWGMLRNSFLQWMDYRVHMPVVQIILSGKYDVLFTEGHTSDMIPFIVSLSDDIEKAYGINSVTDTLITKILLGVFGCAPAYDRYFRNAAAKYKVCSSIWGERSLRAVWSYYEEHIESFEKLRHELLLDGYIFPPMKLMDMCLWQIGFDEDPSKEGAIYGE